MTLPRLFILCAMLLCLSPGVSAAADLPASPHPIDGEWLGIGKNAGADMYTGNRASINIAEGNVMLASGKSGESTRFRITRMGSSRPSWLGEPDESRSPYLQRWDIQLVNDGTGEEMNMRARIRDNAVLQLYVEKSDGHSEIFFLKEGFVFPTEPPSGRWIDDGGNYADIFDLDTNRSDSLVQFKVDGPYEKAAHYELTPLEIDGNALMFRMGDADVPPEFYRAIIRVTENVAVMTSLKKSDSGLAPDPSRSFRIFLRLAAGE